MKKCTKCKVTKPLSEFCIHNAMKSGKRCRCKVCEREDAKKYYSKPASKEVVYELHLRRTFDISLKEYDTMRIGQDYSCKICGKHEDNMSTRLHVDHCHATDKIRGLLCYKCNALLGYAKDSVETLRKAIEYLQPLL